MSINWEGLTVDDIDALIARATVQRQRRVSLDEMRAFGRRYVNEGGAPHRVLAEAALSTGLNPVSVVAGAEADLPERAEGEVWLQPQGAHDAYREGAVVLHRGKTWRSVTPINVWEPGVSGWREVADEDGNPPAWVQPTGAHDAYEYGEQVTHVGQVWVSVHDENVWEPGVFGWDPVAAPVEPTPEEPEPEPDPEEPEPTEPTPEEPDPEEPEEPTYPEFVQPTGDHDAYEYGDRVIFEGQVYESIHEGPNSWSPSQYPPAWRLIEGGN